MRYAKKNNLGEREKVYTFPEMPNELRKEFNKIKNKRLKYRVGGMTKEGALFDGEKSIRYKDNPEKFFSVFIDHTEDYTIIG